MSNTLPHKTIWLIYDGECPICSPTANAIKIKKAAGDLMLINARESHPIVKEVIQQGLNLDEGFVVKTNDQYYHGAEAMNFLALIGTRSDWFNRINVLLFSNKTMAKIFYPAFRAMRNIVLKLNGIKKINRNRDDNE